MFVHRPSRTHKATFPSLPSLLPPYPDKLTQEDKDYGENTPGMVLRTVERVRETLKTPEMNRKQLS